MFVQSNKMQSNKKTNLRKRDWSQLQDDICRIIVKKLWFYRYHHKFAMGCKAWYRITMELYGPFRKNSLYLLLPYDNEKETSTLYQISDSETYTFNLPELRDKWVHGCSQGWLATTDIDLHITLVNPLTRAQIPLPEPTELLEIIDTYPSSIVFGKHYPLEIKEHMTKLVLSENPNSSSTSCVVATIMTTFQSLFVCRLGDKSWTRLILKPRRIDYDHCEGLDDIIFFQRKLYATVRDGKRMVIVDFDDNNFRVRHVRGPKKDFGELNILSGHLVECSGDLLMILKRGHLPKNTPPKTVFFELFRFEKESEKWSRINEIGDKCLFLGPSESVSICAAEVPGCKPNCIYYLDHFHEGRDEEEEFGYEVDNAFALLELRKLYYSFDVLIELLFLWNNMLSSADAWALL